MGLFENAKTQSVRIQGKKTHFRWWIAALFFIVYTIATADRANLGVALPYIQKEFGISNTEAGTLVSLLFFGYAAAQIPAGFILKRFGVRKVLPISMLFTSIFTGLMATTSSIPLLKFFRLGLGVSEGPLPISITTTINNWFPAKEKGTATALYIAASKFGPVIVPVVSVIIIEMAGWREIFYLFAIPGIILAVVWYFFIPNKPSENKFCSIEEIKYIENEEKIEKKYSEISNTKTPSVWLDKLIRAKKVNHLDSVSKVFRSWNIIGNAIGYLFMVGIVNVIMSWIPTYLITEKNFASIKMGFLASAPFMGAVAGNIIGGWISDRLLHKRRKPLMLLSALCTSFMMYSLIYAPNNSILLGILLFTTGLLLNLGYSAYSVYAMGVTTKETYPIAYGIVNTGGQIGGAVAPLLVGIILDSYNWNFVFSFLAICSVLSLLVILTIDEPINDKAV
ncbi:MFS transporter [Lysinibacillus fusiformis]|uniref:MFS transporter n=1 Tax=Lysinibacillus fusiformis TaxID=28031 RepID=UPI0023A9D89D|nr:MFS transporter [Lysinibacillus fusiformis]WEA41234.1 MFS transporter [Lysinibacillus fusiformis]